MTNRVSPCVTGTLSVFVGPKPLLQASSVAESAQPVRTEMAVGRAETRETSSMPVCAAVTSYAMSPEFRPNAQELEVPPVLPASVASVVEGSASTGGASQRSYAQLKQPSPATSFMSSHCSVPSTNPSPQTIVWLETSSV